MNSNRKSKSYSHHVRQLTVKSQLIQHHKIQSRQERGSKCIIYSHWPFPCAKILAITYVIHSPVNLQTKPPKKKKQNRAMGTEPSSTLKLPLFSVNSQEDLGTLTPLHTLASIPFSWEEEPGKPRPCTDLIPLPNSICLEPPPRLYMESNKSCSPTTVFDGPYITSKPKFSSFRFLRDRRRQGSFDSTASSETGQLSAFVLGKKKVESKRWWRRSSGVKGKSGADSADCVSLNDECTMKMATLKRSGSFSGLSQAKTHIWATIYEGFKQVIPWKSKKSKKEALIG